MRGRRAVLMMVVGAILLTSCHDAARSASAPYQEPRLLRVCADPNNLPFSNRQQQGFENELAKLLAGEMGARLEYVWWAQRRGFVRNTLKANDCDVILGMPASYELAMATAPYYRSTFVFVSRADRGIDIESLDDPDLRSLKIGIHVGGDDGEATAPGLALARRGLAHQIRGYSVYGDYSQPDPPARILDAVAKGEIDVAVVWGPFAGWFARRQGVPLRVQPVQPEIDLPFLPMVYDVSFGVRRSDVRLKEELESIIERRRADIDAILSRYGVPRADTGAAS